MELVNGELVLVIWRETEGETVEMIGSLNPAEEKHSVFYHPQFEAIFDSST